MNINKTKISDIKKIKKPTTSGKIGRAILAFFIFLIIFAVLMLALGFGYQYAYAEKFYPGVKIAGYDVSGDNKNEAEKYLKIKAGNIAKQKVKINTVDGFKEATLQDLSVSVDIDSTINEAFNFGRTADPVSSISQEFNALFNNKNFPLKINISQETPDKLKELAPNLINEAKNAQFKYEDGQIKIEEEKSGQTIDTEQFKKDISDVINNNLYANAINLKLTYSLPKITTAKIEELKPFYQQIVSDNIIINNPNTNKSYIAKTEDIAKWVNVKEGNNQINLGINSGEVNNYAAELAKKVNKKVINKKVNAVTNVVVTEGQDGLFLDEGKLAAGIENILNNRINNLPTEAGNTVAMIIAEVPKEEQKVQPEEIKTDGGTAGMTSGRYIELNLSQQMLYLYDTDYLIGAYQVSTGKWSMPTPIGTRYIEDKSDRAWSQTYGLYMPYWNGIGGGYGIHELPEWPGGYKEGEAHLGTPVSHGCIRLGVGSAEFVYNWAPIGTPVFIHR